MESKSGTLSTTGWPRVLQRIISPLLPSLLVSVSYVDPGKFSAAVEGGSRFGSDLVGLVLLFNVAAILCQYLSARVAIATSKDLTQICNEEYDKITCFFLGVQAELSMILLELTMVLGAAHGLNSISGFDLFTCVFLTMMAAFLFPIFALVHENAKAKIVYILLALAVVMSYFFGVLMGQPDESISSGGVLHKLGGESAFVLMGLLGASIMPHNFYLQSSIVQRQQETSHLSKDAACYEQFFVTACIFSGIFLINYALMNLAANVFYSAGLVLLTFQDALSLLDQVYRSSLVPFALVLILFFCNQIVALNWSYARRMVIHEFLGIDIPVWLHHATIRIIAVIPALCCVRNGGAEGLYQLLVFSQILVALMLPSSVIPLFRIASSRTLMGACKISRVLEFSALVTFVWMIGLKAIFVKEMVFGYSDWASTLRWSIENNVPVPYVTLLVMASGSFCFMLWLAATPLKSASSGPDAHVWELQTSLPEPLADTYGSDAVSPYLEKPIQMVEPTAVIDDNLQNAPLPVLDVKLPETLLDSETFPHLTTSEENKSEVPLSVSFTGVPEAGSSREKIPGDSASIEVSDGLLHETGDLKSMLHHVPERPLVEGGLRNNKDDGHSWELDGTKKEPESSLSLSHDGPASFKSLHGRSEEPGSGTGSLSRLGGLGRAARRQMTVILDEFWGQLFDFHGQPTQEARAKKLDILLGINSKMDSKSSPVSVKESRKALMGIYSSSGGQPSESLTNSSLYSRPQHQLGQGYSEASYGVQQGSSHIRSPHMQLLESHVSNFSPNCLDASERRYSSLRAPATSVGYDQQPATVHGYQLHSYIDRIAKGGGSSYSNDRTDLFAPKYSPSVTSKYGDSLYRSPGPKPQSALSNQIPPGFQNVVLSRNSSSQTQRPYYDHSSLNTVETTGSPVAEKKYYSLPDISGLRISPKDALNPGSPSQWDNQMRSSYLSPNSTFDRNNSASPVVGRMSAGFSGHSASEVCRDAFSLQFNSGSGSGSIWSRQPYEQFGVAEKSSSVNGEHIGIAQSSISEEMPSTADMERKLIQSFRYCILRLLKLEGSDWLFSQSDGADEHLIDSVAARERFHHEAETNQMSDSSDTAPYLSSDRKSSSSLQSDESDYTKSMISFNPYCGEGCIYQSNLIVSFGVFCIHRILELSLMESRPELWGKYTYVLNRLQGIIDLAFFNSRPPPTPCFCLDILPQWQQKSKMATGNGSLPPTSKLGKGKSTTGAMMLELVKDVEITISSRKGRSGTAAGDVAFPKGKENLASVLKRYKRRLSSKP